MNKGIYKVLEQAKILADINNEHLLYECIEEQQNNIENITDYDVHELSRNDLQVIHNAIDSILEGCIITEKKKKHIIGCVCSDIIEELGDEN